MFFAIPLENKPTLRNPPWMTVLIIVINLIVFFGPQSTEERAQDRATAFYVQSVLPNLELSAYLTHLEATHRKEAPAVRAALAQHEAQDVLGLMRRDEDFMGRLRRQEIITPSHPKFTAWEADRRTYEHMVPPPFTERWAKDFRAPIGSHPETWITSAFLHADSSHLIGNMVFLFLFGFTVELALGRLWFLSFYLLGATGASLMSAWAYAGMGFGLGASGAIAALMSMYAVLYRFQKINFFYSLFFYFNVVRAPAIILLPLWIGNELIQHVWAHSNVGYMTHLGGLLSGAALMMSFRATRTARVTTQAPSADQAFQAVVEQATAAAEGLQLETACQAWARAVKMQPDNLMALEKYFNTAALWPSKEHFHRAAAAAFRLKAVDASTLAFQHQAFRTYFDKAKPHARLTAQDMARLGNRFARAGFMEDASKLCQALFATDPQHPDAIDLMCVCANANLRAQQTDMALRWLPALQQHAPQHPTTLRLLELRG